MPVAICADESARSAADVLHLIREGAVDAVNIKPMKSGVVESLAIWEVATAAGLDLMIGGMLESVLAMSFSVHFAAGLGGFEYVDLDTPMFIAEHPFAGGFEQDGARLSVARVEAGHGVRIG
jgi:L-alanine-DL-glutamate epimerase-like enolase superfamily enzyme